jgi:predicted lysophospholipase L1 biosynthesis ABC-type transport system permease subunit
MLAIAGLMALLLGVVGIHGVISYTVSQRRREIEIRAALGAQQGQMKRMFVGHGLLLVSIGVVIALVAAAGLTRLMSSLPYGVSSLDPVTYLAVPLILVMTTVLACYLPAGRAHLWIQWKPCGWRSMRSLRFLREVDPDRYRRRNRSGYGTHGGVAAGQWPSERSLPLVSTTC